MLYNHGEKYLRKGKIMELVQNHDTIFALDIGTRTVIGLVATVDDNKLVVLAEEVREHPGRAMLDGQIHDIPQVAAVVSGVKNALEARIGCNLYKVAVAAAGRSLYTDRVSVQQDIDENKEIDSIVVRSIEMEALREAHRLLDEQADMQNRYYCVGHSVLGYTLDGYPLANLIGHRGRVIGCEVIATFLPVSVVNGLYAVLERCGLEPVNLTLEPIAAIDLAIPENYRLLNLALVDMGAGTSDLAVSRDGNIVAYGMVPVAGDEITEAVVEGCLVDFDTAESIKRKISSGEDISFTDIVGIEHKLSCEEILNIVDPVLDKLAEKIADNILEINGGQPPRSVFCIGGGARVPTFTERLARCLGLSPRMVTLRDRSNLQNVVFDCGESCSIASGPEGVTVVGIASVAVKRMGFDFMSVIVNGKEYRLFNTRNLSVSDALGLVQFNPRDLIGKNGKDLYFNLNGKRRVVFGETARHAEIRVNRAQANLQSMVKDGDEIFVVKAQNGRDAKATVKEYLPEKQELLVILNGKKEVLKPLCLVNGNQVQPGYEIKQGDDVVIYLPHTVGQLAKMRGYEPNEVVVEVNSSPAGAEYILQDGDRVDFYVKKGDAREGTSLSSGLSSERENKKVVGRQEISRINETVDNHNDTKDDGKNISTEETSHGGISVRVNGEEIVLTKPKPIFVDIFKHIEFDCTQSHGVLVLKRNGINAKYTDPLSEGDEIEVYWENSND